MIRVWVILFSLVVGDACVALHQVAKWMSVGSGAMWVAQSIHQATGEIKDRKRLELLENQWSHCGLVTAVQMLVMTV